MAFLSIAIYFILFFIWIKRPSLQHNIAWFVWKCFLLALQKHGFYWLCSDILSLYEKKCINQKHKRLKYYGLIYSISGGGSKKDEGEKKKEDVLNIFSVASGHLYERFLRWVTFSSQTLARLLLRPYASSSLLPWCLKLIFHSLCLFQDNDAVRTSSYQNPGQVLVPQELPLSIFQGTSWLLTWLHNLVFCLFKITLSRFLRDLFLPSKEKIHGLFPPL